MEYKLREYQDDFCTEMMDFVYNSSFKKGFGISPVGTGKSLYPSLFAHNVRKPVLVIQPNVELLEQNVDKARSFGLDPTIYSASAGLKEISNLTYATPLSIVNNIEHFKHFKHVIIDECHINMSNSMFNGKVKEKGKLNSFLEILNPEKTIGLTATPIQLVTTGRGSELKMIDRSMRSYWLKSKIFAITQITDIHEKYWANITKNIVNNDTSLLEKKRFNSPEFTNESIIKQYESNELMYQILEQYDTLLGKGIDNILTFVPSVEQALKLKKENKDFEVVYDKTPKRERKAIVEAFKRGDISNLINVEIFTCLSEDTEVLTKDGWKKKDDINIEETLVAQWDIETSEITFVKPIHKHEHLHNSEMVTLEGRYTSFKVTDDHDLIIKKYKKNKYKKIKAIDAVGKKYYIPVSGFSKPDDIEILQETVIKSKKKFITSNSYNYRKKGMTKEESYIEAEKQYDIKMSLKYKNPRELSIDECRFIGFFIGDGCKYINDGSERYSITNSLRTPKLIEWIETLLHKCDIHYSKKVRNIDGLKDVIICGNKCNAYGYVTYNMAKGTGGHNQNFSGLYRLIPYLNKKGSNLLKGLNREQYFALMEGLYKADGSHGDNKIYKGEPIVGEYKELFDLLQEIGVCRGYRVSIREVKKTPKNIKQLYSISLCDKQEHQMTNDLPKKEKCYNELVWCLTMPKGSLVTRHNGKVTIMGNTGFDHPELKGIICARETMSFQLYYQIYGRLVRNIFRDNIMYKKEAIFTDLTGNSGRFGNINNITFETNDYINGSGMWCDDRLLTGYPFGDWNMPHRSSFIGGDTSIKTVDDITLKFGKYKGKSLKKSFEKDQRYFTWMLNEFTWSNHNKELKQKIETLLKQNVLHGK